MQTLSAGSERDWTNSWTTQSANDTEMMYLLMFLICVHAWELLEE